jgi:hypothetical protein
MAFADLESIVSILVKHPDLVLCCIFITEHESVEVGYFVQDLDEITARYLLPQNLLIFWDIFIFFMNFFKEGYKNKPCAPRGAK